MDAVKAEENLYDLAVVGGGPAGLTAALYMARAKYRVLVLEKAEIGGQITITAEIVNYPGVVKTSGKELTENMRRQAENFGAEFAAAEVLAMELTGDIKILRTTKGEYRALGVILATGANLRKLGFKGEREFQGRGVAYCATCDGEFFSGLDVFVIGGGFAAVEEGIFLTKYAKKVTLVVLNFPVLERFLTSWKTMRIYRCSLRQSFWRWAAKIWSPTPDSGITGHKKSGSMKRGMTRASVSLYLPDMCRIRTGSDRK